jgi:hypothetical protein
VKTEKEQEESPGAVAYLDSLELESLAGLGIVWERGCGDIFKKFKIFLLKFNMVCMFWIVLM